MVWLYCLGSCEEVLDVGSVGSFVLLKIVLCDADPMTNLEGR